ncbi:MAG: hydrolase TatD [Marinilabiliales bacterium]|nr:MAG: hydrolase TatD [Marinilabiliales bacterium]
MQLIDTHTHIYHEDFDEDFDEVVQRAKDTGVEAILFPDIDSRTRDSMKQKAALYPGFIYTMRGLHPSDVKENFKEELDLVEKELNSHNDVVAVGEIGIDLYWDQTYIKEQKEAFAMQLEMAAQRNLPVSIHQRNSMPEVMDIIRIYKGRARGVLHCFSGNVAEAKEAIDMGFMLGIGGVLTFKNSGVIDIAQHSGIQNLVLETDAPYLAPTPHRGRRNEPAYLELICDFLANVMGESPEDTAAITTANAKRVFQNI